MFRMLLITMLIGLTMATFSHHQNNQNRMAHQQPQLKKAHHITALDQLIKKKPTGRFLGRNFFASALANQGENKYLQLNGKEERGVNGTIQVNKQNVFIDITEAKDGHFLVQNQKKKIVGRVDLHSGSNKHLSVHRTPTGEQYVNARQLGNAVLSVEQDLGTRFPAGSVQARSAAAKQHLSMHVMQSHITNGNVHITNNRPQYNRQQQQYRYRRQAETPINTNCRELNCL